MKRFETVFIRKPKRFIKATLLDTYDHYPACRIRFRGKEIIISSKDVIHSHEFENIQKEKLISKAKIEYANLLERWTDEMNWTLWKSTYGEYWAWNQLKKLRRIGLISHGP